MCMKLVFIRHGDPDYKNDSVTAAGAREAALLAERARGWKNIAGIFVSPYGRAQATAKPLLETLAMQAETMPWLREFDHHIIYPRTGLEKSAAWDWYPRDFYAEDMLFDRDRWHNLPAFRAGELEKHYTDLCNGFDSLLLRYGYKRIEPRTAIYCCTPHLTPEAAAVDTHLQPSQPNLDDRTLVFVCHLGVMFGIIAHLTGMSPMQMWQGFFVAPSSVTVAGAEERVPGEVAFRVQMLGDVRHLTENGLEPSASGFFGNVVSF